MGHGNLWRMVMGMAHRRLGESELAECAAWHEAMDRLGISSGLIYPPSSYADTQELIAISRTVAEYGGIYATHMRSEGARLLESVEEAITIGEQAGLPVHISHHKAMGEANWGRVRESLALIDARRAAGVDITLDQYPYIASATGLKSSIPQWAHADGVEAMRQRVVDPVIGARIRQEMAASQTRWD